MKNKNATEALNEAIVRLENKQALELGILKKQFYVTIESLKPFNLLKNTIKEVVFSGEVKENLLNNTIGLTTGYLSKKVLLGALPNPLSKLLGPLLQFVVANVVSKHTGGIKSVGEKIIHRIFNRKKEGNKVQS